MSEWIAHSKGLFMQSLAEVGQNHQHALDLQTQHQHFTANCMVSVCVCVSQLKLVFTYNNRSVVFSSL